MSNKNLVNKALQAKYAQNSLSEIELCARWSKCPRTALNRRNSGNTWPPHFMSGSQVRYLLSEIESFDSLSQGI